MKRYDAWSEPDPQCGYGGARCELYERTMGQYVTFDDHERAVAALTAERDEWKEKERITSELFEAACNDLGDAQEELAAAIEYAHSRDAERDELQRRLDAILDRLPEGGVWCYGCNRATVPIRCESFYEHIPREYKQMKTTFHCPICKRKTYAKDPCVDSLRAIAEGRTE